MKKIYYVLYLTFVLIMSGCAAEDFSTAPAVSENVVQEKAVADQHEFPRTEVPVTRVIDGDTIKAIINGNEESVRFLLVDTPETNHPRMSGPQPFGKEAKELVEKLLEGGKVEIEMDVGERDRYGRLLAYLYVDGVSLQEELLRNGLARVAYIYPPNTRYVDEYQVIQQEAQEKAIGIWSVENYAQEDGFFPEFMDNPTLTEPEKEKEPAAKGCTVKGNISSSGEKIYHILTGAYYDRTNPEECFDTEEEAKAAGYRKSKR